MSYGTETVIPLEIGIPSIRTQVVENGKYEAFLAPDLDLIEERREQTALQLGAYLKRLTKAYYMKVNPREFKIRDFVLRKVIDNKKDPREGKLGTNWEGPYKIISVASKGVYRLEDCDGK